MAQTKHLGLRWIPAGSVALALLACVGCGRERQQVTVFTSLDRVYSEPVLQKFEQETGVKVNAVYDVEASKTTGLVMRLIQQKKNPEADVFWNSEVGRTLNLRDEGVLTPCSPTTAADIPAYVKDPQGYWYGFAARARVIVYNTELIAAPEEGDAATRPWAPTSILDLTKPEWKGKVALGNPSFGTTATHAAALFAHLGEAEAKRYFADLKANEVRIVPGNAAVRDQVAAGECLLGLTDTDDVWAGIANSKPVAMVYPDQASGAMGTLVIPNTVCKIKGGPHPEAADRLIAWLLRPEVESMLAAADAHQMPVRAGVQTPEGVPDLSEIRAMPVSFEGIAQAMKPSGDFLRGLFLR